MLGEQQENRAEALYQTVLRLGDAVASCDRRTEPLRWANLQSTLGDTLAMLASTGAYPSAANAAIGAYWDALKELSRDATPLDWSITQNNLGCALLSMAERAEDEADFRERFGEALGALQSALEVRTETEAPADWAVTQANIALLRTIAFLRNGERSQLFVARVILDKVAGVFTRLGARDQLEWIDAIRQMAEAGTEAPRAPLVLDPA